MVVGDWVTPTFPASDGYYTYTTTNTREMPLWTQRMMPTPRCDYCGQDPGKSHSCRNCGAPHA